MENKSLTYVKRMQSDIRLKASHSKAYTIIVCEIYIYPFFIYLNNYLCERVYLHDSHTLMLKAAQRLNFRRMSQPFLNKLEKTVFGGAA